MSSNYSKSASGRKRGPILLTCFSMLDAEANDHEGGATGPVHEDWVGKEERRRLWWSLWEADIFTATIRRLPPAIDGKFQTPNLPDR